MKRRNTTAIVLDIMAEQADAISINKLARDKRLQGVRTHQVRGILQRLTVAGVLAYGPAGYEVPIDPDPPDRYRTTMPERQPVPRKP